MVTFVLDVNVVLHLSMAILRSEGTVTSLVVTDLAGSTDSAGVVVTPAVATAQASVLGPVVEADDAITSRVWRFVSGLSDTELLILTGWLMDHVRDSLSDSREAMYALLVVMPMLALVYRAARRRT